MNAPLPTDEARRLAALRQYQVLDTPPAPAFDELASLAAQICEAPMALVTLVDERRQWLKSKIGVAVAETPRDSAFCAYAIAHPDEVTVVTDAALEPRFASNPLVCGETRTRFYAGAPLLTAGGHALGTLCVLDRCLRTLTDKQLAALQALSRQVVAQLELHRQAAQLAAEIAERKRAETLLKEQFAQLTASKQESDRLLAQAQKSRRALLSVLEDEKLAGHCLRASEERFRQMAENINEVFWLTDPTLNELLYVSPAYEKIWGRSCADLYAAPHQWLESIHPEDRASMKEEAATIATSGSYDAIYRILHPDNTERWIHDQRFPVRDATGKIQRIVGIAEDVTEKHKLEEQFLQAQKIESIGQLAGGVAHDFNNLLSAMLLQLGLLQGDASLPSDTKEALKEVENGATRAATLTRQLLLFSRRESPNAKTLDLNGLIEELLNMLGRLLGENIHMKFIKCGGPLWICADAGMVEQVVVNLCVNARDAMPKGGELTLSTKQVAFTPETVPPHNQARIGHFILLSVSDAGCGMDETVLKRIFEPYYTTKGRGKGTGLGLATVYGIVKQHEGWVEAESKVGRGSTFRVYLPARKEPSIPSASPAKERTKGGAETILLVEDETGVRGSAALCLRKLGYSVLEAADGEEALKVWSRHEPDIDLLLSDMVMPGETTGLELAERFSGTKAGLRVILSSGYSEDLAGFDSATSAFTYLPKPYSPSTLAQVVRECLDQAR